MEDCVHSLRLLDLPLGASPLSSPRLYSLRFLGGECERSGEGDFPPFRRRGGLRLGERERDRASERLEPLDDSESEDFDRERELPELDEDELEAPSLDSESELDDDEDDLDLLRFFCRSFSLSSKILSAMPAFDLNSSGTSEGGWIFSQSFGFSSNCVREGRLRYTLLDLHSYVK